MSKITSVITEDAASICEEYQTELQQLAGTDVLVTGAAGFMFSYLVDVLAVASETVLAKNPCRILALDNFRAGLPERVEHLRNRPNVKFLNHDVTKPLELARAPEWIIHGASIASPTFYRQFPLETIDANVTGTRHMLDLARRGARGVIIMSTSEIYGDPDARFVPTSEEYRGNVSCTGPRACYDESKRLAETLATTYYRLYQTPVKIVRPFNVFGPGQRIDDKRIIPDLMTCAMNRSPLVLLSDGTPTRAFCYARDAARALLTIMLYGQGGEPYNLGNDEAEISMKDLATLFQQVAGAPTLPIEFKTSADRDYTTDNPQRRCPNLTKLRGLRGWKPTVTVREGLERTLRSYREDQSPCK